MSHTAVGFRSLVLIEDGLPDTQSPSSGTLTWSKSLKVTGIGPAKYEPTMSLSRELVSLDEMRLVPNSCCCCRLCVGKVAAPPVPRRTRSVLASRATSGAGIAIIGTAPYPRLASPGGVPRRSAVRCRARHSTQTVRRSAQLGRCPAQVKASGGRVEAFD